MNERETRRITVADLKVGDDTTGFGVLLEVRGDVYIFDSNTKISLRDRAMPVYIWTSSNVESHSV